MKKVLAIAATMILGACSTPPSITKSPELSIPDEFPQGPAYRKDFASAQSPGDVSWQDLFADPRILKVIELALKNNQDLKTNTLKLERAKTLLELQRSTYFPQVSADLTGSRQRQPSQFNGGKTVLNSQYSGTLGVSAYEVDFFGKLRSLNDAALNTYLASKEAKRSFQLSLIANVAYAYMAMDADLASLHLAQSTLKNQQKALELIQKRFELGVGTELDVNQASTTVSSAKAEVARYTRLLAQDRNALSLLMGTPVTDQLMPEGQLHDLEGPIELRAGVQSKVLLNRPDVMAAEYQLKAADAQIQAARAAFFPSITLTGSYGSASKSLSELFTAGTEAWSFVPKVTLPIFDAGRLQANLKISKIDQQIAITNYQKTVETAFREVSDALAARGTLETELNARQSLLTTSEKSLSLSKARFNNGIDSYLSVLDSQRSLYSAQQGVVATRLACSVNLLRLYQALGGSWSSHGFEQQKAIKP